MWDMYKTALPFMAMFYPKNTQLINGLLSIAEEQNGRFSVCVFAPRKIRPCSNQARSLAHNLILTAHAYRIEGIDYRRALKLMLSDLEDGPSAKQEHPYMGQKRRVCDYRETRAGAWRDGNRSTVPREVKNVARGV